MHATHYGAVPRSVLEDYPPIDKPTRFPLRQRWRTTGSLPQGPELTELSCPRRFLVRVDPGSGQIRAACERTLAQGRAALAEAMAPGAVPTFGAIQAHSYVDPHSGEEMEPLVFVYVDAPRPQWQRLSEDLRSRGARMHEVEMQANRVVLRAQLALRRLLGFGGDALAATGGGVHVATWLVRYEPAATHGR